MITQVMWIISASIVGGLVGLHRSWRRQAADAVSCVVALGLACWQHRRVVSYVRCLWPGLGNAVQLVALLYLFAALYGLSRLLVSLYLPQRTSSKSRCWLSGLIGATEAGVLAALSIVILPRP